MKEVWVCKWGVLNERGGWSILTLFNQGQFSSELYLFPCLAFQLPSKCLSTVCKWHSTMKKKASCSQNSPLLLAIKNRVPQEETKECLGLSHPCLWERSGEERPTALGNRGRRGEYKSALWASKWWMAKCQLRALHTIEFALLQLLKVILLLIFCGRCSYSFLTETLDFRLLDTQMHLSHPKGDFGSQMPGNLSTDQNTAAQACLIC